jgi:hypothetical protein
MPDFKDVISFERDTPNPATIWDEKAMKERPEFKDVIYFPSFSVGLGPYMKREEAITADLNYRFYDDKFPEAFRHKYFLVTAGHFYKQKGYRESLGLNNGSLVIGDSGGFQIASGAFKKFNPDKTPTEIFEWLEENSDLAVNLDVPPRMTMEGKFKESLALSKKHFDLFQKLQTGKTKFLNVIHSYDNPEDYAVWYDAVKHYEFNGWCVGSGGGSLARTMYAVALLLQRGEFAKKNVQYIHFLGQTKIFDMLFYNFLQRMLDENGYSQVQVTTDSSTPVQYSLYGNVIHSANYSDLSYKLFYMDTKVKADADYRIPCQASCPICDRIGFLTYNTYDTYTRHMLSFHNFFMFLHIFKDIKKLASTHLELLKGFIKVEQLKVFESLFKMFAEPEKALAVYEKNKGVYAKLSSDEKSPQDIKKRNAGFED